MSDHGSHIDRTYYCTEAVIPIRSSPSEASEMISQLIYGDFASHLEQQGSWTKIKCEFDGYEGWVDSKMLSSVPADSDFSGIEWKWVAEYGAIDYLHTSFPLKLPVGARIPFVKETDPPRINGIESEVWDPKHSKTGVRPNSVFIDTEEFNDPISVAMLFLHVPYLWGGTSSYGIDCSGLTQRVFRILGKSLPRDSRDQEKLGESISFEDRRSGDLAFFSKPNQEKITHVGLVIDNENIIHASGRVRIDKLTSTGIIHSEELKLTHELISIKR